DAQFTGGGMLVVRVDSSAAQSGTPALWRFAGTGGIAPITDLLSSGGTLAASSMAPDSREGAYAAGATQPSNHLWSSQPVDTSAVGPRMPTTSVVVRSGDEAGQRKFDIGAAQKAAPEHVTDLIWTPDSQRLAIITRTDGTPARSRLVLADLSTAASDGDLASTT